MSDVQIAQSVETYDWSLDWLLKPNGTLADGDQLASAVWVALFTDRRADASDMLPDPSDDDRRGWWGDTDAETIRGGWPIGSRLWLLTREKITGPGAKGGALAARIQAYAYEALKPFVQIGLASRVQATAERNGLQRIELVANLYRDNGRAVSLRFQTLWD